jgi:HSP20 family protein
MSKQLVVRKDPFDYALGVRDIMDRMFDYSLFRPVFPWRGIGDETLSIDMVETDDALIVKAAVPGVKPEDINISISGDILTVQGEFQEEQESKEHNVHIRERQYGHFRRDLNLPTAVDSDRADAHFDNGILTLTLPKAEDARPKVITVKARNGK